MYAFMFYIIQTNLNSNDPPEQTSFGVSECVIFISTIQVQSWWQGTLTKAYKTKASNSAHKQIDIIENKTSRLDYVTTFA